MESFAAPELAALAEEWMTNALAGILQSTGFTADIVTGEAPILPGGDSTYEIGTKIGIRRLSLARMLVNTNDGFTGVSALPLPLGASARWHLRTCDAKSEENTELYGWTDPVAMLEITRIR